MSEGRVTTLIEETGSTLHPVDRHLSVRLRELRQRARLSQASLAERVKLSPGMIHWYEVGESRISASTLFDLAAALGCTVADFYAGFDAGVVSGCVELGRAPFTAVLETQSGAALIKAYPRVAQTIQNEIAGLAQVLADA